MRKIWTMTGPILLAAAGLVPAGCGPSGGTEHAVNSKPTAAPDEAEPAEPPVEITLQTLDFAGYEQLVKKHRGKVVFVDIWATW